MTVPDAEYSQTGTYHEFYHAPPGRILGGTWLEVGCYPDSVSVQSSAPGNYGPEISLNLNDARILRDILTEHIARQDRKPA